MKKGILDIKLMDRPVPRVSQSNDCANSSRLDNRAECFIIINTGLLSKTTKNLASLVSFQRAISMKFVLENPFTSDNIGLGRARNKVPSLVVGESSKFLFHGLAPVRIGESITTCAWQRGEDLGVQTEARLPVSNLPTGSHAMGVGYGWDGNSPSWKLGAVLDIARWRWDDGRSSRSGSLHRRCGRRAWCRRTPMVDMDDGRPVDRHLYILAQRVQEEQWVLKQPAQGAQWRPVRRAL